MRLVYSYYQGVPLKKINSTLAFSIAALFVSLLCLGLVAIGIPWYYHRLDNPPPITSAVCDPGLDPPREDTGDNIVAYLTISLSGEKKSFTLQRLCDGRGVRVDAASVEVAFDERTRVVYASWSAKLPIEWKAVTLLTRSGINPRVTLKDPYTTDYSRVLEADERLDGVVVYGNAPSLPPSSMHQ